MTAAEFNPNERYSARPLRARPTGARAAIGMGVAATFILLAALVLLPREPKTTEPKAVTQVAPPRTTAAARPSKLSSKISVEALEASALMAKPFSAVDLAAPEFAAERKTMAARDGENGSGRIDAITLGRFAMGAPFMRVDVHQDIAEKEKTSDFFLDMTRHAAQAGLNVAKIGQPSALNTRLGSFETAEIRLSQPASQDVAASERSCLATRLIDGARALEIAGLACGAATRPIDRVALGCLLDRISAPNPENPGVKEFFAQAASARSIGCGNISRDDLTATIPTQKNGARSAQGPRRAHAKTTRQGAQMAR
ncbi:MAG: hypothetical protein AB7F41_05420 [Methylocystis sp.]|uniref:hypothetical protein n=1 Tax=Methylocystis sp. TaxID=1911079 RepID=UPI003D13CCE2